MGAGRAGDAECVEDSPCVEVERGDLVTVVREVAVRARFSVVELDFEGTG